MEIQTSCIAFGKSKRIEAMWFRSSFKKRNPGGLVSMPMLKMNRSQNVISLNQLEVCQKNACEWDSNLCPHQPDTHDQQITPVKISF